MNLSNNWALNIEIEARFGLNAVLLDPKLWLTMLNFYNLWTKVFFRNHQISVVCKLRQSRTEHVVSILTVLRKV